MPADSVADVFENKLQLLIIYHSTNLVPPAQQDEYPFKRRRLADDPGIPWLEEIHSKVWNKKDLKQELF